MSSHMPDLPKISPVKWAKFALDQLCSDQWEETRKKFYHEVGERFAHAQITEQSFLAELLVAQLSLLGFVAIKTDPNLGEALLVLRLQYLEKLPTTIGNVTEILVWYSRRVAECGAKGISGHSAIAQACSQRLGLDVHPEFAQRLEAEFVSLGKTWRSDARQYRYTPVEPSEIPPNAQVNSGPSVNSPPNSATRGEPDCTEEGMMVAALWTETKVGPNDELLNRHNRKAYWISTLRYPGAGWQTAVFDRKRILWLTRPIFRVNEMEDPFIALLNHCTSIIVVAEATPQSWPEGMKWSEPSETSWLTARAKVMSEPPKASDPAAIIHFYDDLRRQYGCTHRN